MTERQRSVGSVGPINICLPNRGKKVLLIQRMYPGSTPHNWQPRFCEIERTRMPHVENISNGSGRSQCRTSLVFMSRSDLVFYPSPWATVLPAAQRSTTLPSFLRPRPFTTHNEARYLVLTEDGRGEYLSFPLPAELDTDHLLWKGFDAWML